MCDHLWLHRSQWAHSHDHTGKVEITDFSDGGPLHTIDHSTMSTEVDPLLALHQAINSRTKITHSNDSGPCSSLLSATQLVTVSKSWSNSLSETRHSLRVLSPRCTICYVKLLERSIWNNLKEHGLSAGFVRFVSVTERKHDTDWLEGKISDNERIAPLSCELCPLISLHETYIWPAESTTPPGTPPRTTTTGQGSLVTPRTHATDTSTSSPSKRWYATDTPDAEVVKKIKLNEVELRDRNSVLRGIKPNVRFCIFWKRCHWFLWIRISLLLGQLMLINWRNWGKPASQVQSQLPRLQVSSFWLESKLFYSVKFFQIPRC